MAVLARKIKSYCGGGREGGREGDAASVFRGRVSRVKF
jgi:hypothetical protein